MGSDAALTSPAAEEYVIPKELLDAIAIVNNRAPAPGGKVVKVPVSEVFPVSTAIAKEEHREAATIGVLSDEGVFIGQYSPVDRHGHSLGKIFNVYAAPEDLADPSGTKMTATYIDTVKRIAKLKNWNGFNGSYYETDEELYDSLKDGSYDGSWVIPTSELLAGKDAYGNRIQPDNLAAHQNDGALAGTFTRAAADVSSNNSNYWSCTGYYADHLYEQAAQLADSWTYSVNKNCDYIRCRPVRLVEVVNKPV